MKKFVSKMLAGALGLSMLCGVAAAEGETYVSWYTFGDVYLSSVRTALDAAMEAKGLTVVDKDSNANQQTQTDDINTALVTGANAVVVNLVESGAIGTAETLMNAIKEKDVPAVFFNRAVSTDNAEAAELFKGYEKSAFVGTDFTQAGIMQGKMIGEYVLEHFDEIDLNHDGKISYVMFKGDEANQEAIARTKYGVECADEVLTAAGKPALEFYDASNANKYLVDLNRVLRLHADHPRAVQRGERQHGRARDLQQRRYGAGRDQRAVQRGLQPGGRRRLHRDPGVRR